MGRKILDFLAQYIIALISVIITGILFWAFSPEDTVSIKIFMWCVIPLGLCVAISIPQLVKYWTVEDKNFVFPKLKTIVDQVMVFEASDLFSYQCVVTLFYIDDEIERQIGYGYVENIKSDNRCLQIRLLDIEENYNTTFLLKNKKHVAVKPNCPYELIQKNVTLHITGED